MTTVRLDRINIMQESYLVKYYKSDSPKIAIYTQILSSNLFTYLSYPIATHLSHDNDIPPIQQ
ncbi:10783_t:CDS:2, partial [Racocetra persica]